MSLFIGSPPGHRARLSAPGTSRLSSAAREELRRRLLGLIEGHRVVIFSKSYCPHSARVKELFSSLGVDCNILELDQVDDGASVQEVLSEITNQRTVPSIFVSKVHVGGCDRTFQAHQSGLLQKLLEEDPAYDYDLIVIGGGSGGLSCAQEAAVLGRRVMVLDDVVPSPQGTSWGLGGTCVNVGCIPKKLMHQAALLGQALTDSRKFGWEYNQQVKHNWETMTEAIQNHIGSLTRGYRRALREKAVALVNSCGEFVEHHKIKVQQLEKGSPGKLKVVAQSTEGTEMIEGLYNTVSFCRVSGGRMNTTGKIPVNDVEQSSVPYVYAVGDVAEGKPELTPVAVQAGKLLARRLFGGRLEKCDYINAPTVVFTPLEYGCCGYAEEKAVEVYRKENLEVYHTLFWPLEWTVARRDSNTCYAKIICSKFDNDRVIGFHILGPKAGEITQGFAAAMKCGLTKQLLDDTIGIHPTCAEVFTTLEITKSSGLDITQKGC
uniref:Thioredoxin reductase 3 n=1 Tax=Balaenoptera musculus TaxID=9771 RepID=A0A8C0CWN0_BALMU